MYFVPSSGVVSEQQCFINAGPGTQDSENLCPMVLERETWASFMNFRINMTFDLRSGLGLRRRLWLYNIQRRGVPLIC